MRKLTYLIACSADGFIARDDGSIDDFTFEGPHVSDLLHEYPETIPTHLRKYFDAEYINKQFDTVLMGRLTYQTGLDAGYSSPYAHLDQYVFSRTLPRSPDSSVTLVDSRAIETVQRLKQEEGLGIWLCGGGQLASTLFPEIDELVIKSNPFLMGTGRTMFARAFPKTKLELLERREYPNGFSLARFGVRHV